MLSAERNSSVVGAPQSEAPVSRTACGRRPLRIFIIHGSQHLTDHSFNGDGLVAWGFINELARRGHRIHVATDRLDVRTPVPPNLTLVEFAREQKSGLLHYLSYARSVRDYYDRLAAGEGVDVVHQMNPVVRGISLALLGRKVPIVLGTYVGDWVRLKRFPLYGAPSIRVRLTLAAKAAIDAVQQHFATALILATPHALGRVPLSFDVGDRIEFMHHGVDTDLYNPAARASDPAAEPNSVLFVGSITMHKGIRTLVDAFTGLTREVAGAKLVVVGSGSHVDYMKNRLAANGVLDRAFFTGRATREEVAGWMRACSVLCAPSYGEPYGQNVIEAMASGKPVVITTEGGHRHLGDARGVVRVPPGDVDALRAALRAVLTQPVLAREMGRHNRVAAEERHAWAKVTDQLEQIYDRAIAVHES